MAQFRKLCDEVDALKAFLEELVADPSKREDAIDNFSQLTVRIPEILSEVDGFKKRAEERDPAKRLYGPNMSAKVLEFVAGIESTFVPLYETAKTFMDPIIAQTQSARATSAAADAVAASTREYNERVLRLLRQTEQGEAPLRAALVDEEASSRASLVQQLNAGVVKIHNARVETERAAREVLAASVNSWAAAAPQWPLVRDALCVLRRATRRRLSAPIPPPWEPAAPISETSPLPDALIAADIITLDVAASVHHALAAALEKAHGESSSASTVSDAAPAFRNHVSRYVGGALLLSGIGYRRVIQPPHAGGGGAFVLREPNPTEDSDAWSEWYEAADGIQTVLGMLVEVMPTPHTRALESGALFAADPTSVKKRDARTARLEGGVWADEYEDRPLQLQDARRRARALVSLLDELSKDATVADADAAHAMAAALHADVMADRGAAGPSGNRVRELVSSLTDAYAFAQISEVIPGGAADEAGVLPGDLIVYWGGVAARGGEYASDRADGRALLGAVAATTAESEGTSIDVIVLRAIAPGPIALTLRVPRAPARKQDTGREDAVRSGVGLRVDPLSGPLRPAMGGAFRGTPQRRNPEYDNVMVDEAAHGAE